MSVTLKDVEHIAKLARLQLQETEKQEMTHHLNEILAHMDQLNKVDTSNVAPLLHVIELSNVVRKDELKESTPQSEALKNAPSHDEEFFKVPKVIGD